MCSSTPSTPYGAADTRDPRLAPTHAVAFTLALGAPLRRVSGGSAIPCSAPPPRPCSGPILISSYEVHFRENEPGWAITAGVLALALSLPLLRHSIRRPWALPLAIGIVLGTIRQIRPEPGAIVVSAGLACLLVSRASWPRRLALAAVLVASFAGTSAARQAYFDYKFDEATRVVSAAGEGCITDRATGITPSGILSGAGSATRREARIRRGATRRPPTTPPPSSREYQGAGREPNWSYLFWDPVYYNVLADKVRYDITHDPLWYIGVLGRRVARGFHLTTPVRPPPAPGGSASPERPPDRTPLPCSWPRDPGRCSAGLVPRHVTAGGARVPAPSPPDLHGLVSRPGRRDRPGRAHRRCPGDRTLITGGPSPVFPPATSPPSFRSCARRPPVPAS